MTAPIGSPATLASGPVRVSVPATSANLGPGFDSLGLALDLRDSLAAEVIGAGLRITVEGEGADEVPQTRDHLVHAAMEQAFEAMGLTTPPLALHCRNRIPHSRGLGSSSAAIIAGLLLARGLVVDGERRLPDAGVLELATRIEGHPDNVAPALYGGFTVAAQGSGTFQLVRLDVADGVVGVVFVPPWSLSTATARRLLPDTVPHGDAAANAARAAMLVVALTGQPETLLVATDDVLHQPYRRPAMPGSMELVDALRADGYAAVVSGAGPSVLVLGTTEALAPLLERAPAGWTAYRTQVGASGARVEQ